MSLPQRIFGAAGLLILGLFSLVFLGTQVTSCLGPLGRTLVQSIADGCIKPGVGVAMPVGALWLAAAAMVLLPPRRGRFRGAALGGVLGGAFAAIGIGVVTRLVLPTSMTGPTSYGEVITVALPFDWYLLLAAVIAGAAFGLIVGSRPPLRSRTASMRA